MSARRLAACALIAVPALAIGSRLAAQEIPRGPRLLQVVASSSGVVLSIDSLSVSRTGDSTFVAAAVYQFPADSTQPPAADRRVDNQELDCGGMRLRSRVSSFYQGDTPVEVSAEIPTPSFDWEPAGEDELPIVQLLCQYLLGSFAASLPVTRETGDVDDAPDLINVDEVRRALASNYPVGLRDAGVSGTAMMRIEIGADGRVDPARIRTLWATRPPFATAATRVLAVMRFRPARVRGEPVAAWATLPVTFQVEGRRPRRPARDTPPNPAPR